MRDVFRWWMVTLGLFILAYVVRLWCQPVAVVVPHHNVVASVRQKLLAFVADRRIQTKRIILISPDHFSINQHKILTESLDLSTINADHGITNVYVDLIKLWPKAQIDMLLIGQKVTTKQLEPILDAMLNLCQSDCLLVASVDFSHYLPADTALAHDQKTIEWLSQQRSDELMNTDVDSPQSLWLLSSLAKQKGAGKWRLYDHTISGKVETTTHVFGWYQR